MFGLGFGGSFTLIQLVAVESFGQLALGRILGVIIFIDTMGGALGTLLAGQIRTTTGDYFLSFSVVTVVAIIAVINVLMIPAVSEIRIEAMIRAEGLSKNYGPLRAVDDISFSVRPGEVLGFLGPNGAGKTTTMRMLAGFVPASAGYAEICGFRIDSQPLRGQAPARLSAGRRTRLRRNGPGRVSAIHRPDPRPERRGTQEAVSMRSAPGCNSARCSGSR